MLRFLRPQDVLRVCIFGLTLGPIYLLTEWKIKKSKYFHGKILAIELSKYANRKTCTTKRQPFLRYVYKWRGYLIAPLMVTSFFLSLDHQTQFIDSFNISTIKLENFSPVLILEMKFRIIMCNVHTHILNSQYRFHSKLTILNPRLSSSWPLI